MANSVKCGASFLPLQQSADYGAAARACGATVFEADLGPGHALVVQRGPMRLVSRGPMWEAGADPGARRRALRRFARWPGLTVVTPEEGITGLGFIPLVTPMHHAIWDLKGDLRSGLDRRWRNHLSVAERRGWQVEPGGRETLLHLVALEARQRQERRYRALPPAFTEALPERALRIWHWRPKGALGAAMCFVRHGATASYHLAWAGAEARNGAVHQLMLWQAASALRDEGVRWLDLGSVNTEEAMGLARFKLGTGAELRKLGSTLLVLAG